MTAQSDAGTRALVVLSGGQDSTTCLYWAMDRFGPGAVATLTFDYGQRHRIEIESATRVATRAGVPNVLLPVDTLAVLGGNTLTDDTAEVTGARDAVTGLPDTFVPGRNLIFLTYAAAWAWQHGYGNLVTGVAQTDYSGYPDCREETIQALELALQKGMESDVRIHTPLMHLSKKETVLLARDLGALEALADSHTCYLGERPPCGRCDACRLRARGFEEAGIADPLASA